MQGQILKLKDQIRVQEQQLKEKQSELDALKNDPKTVERLTREKLGYARPDETVIYFEGTNAVR